jgi:hypothetical protein
MTDSPHPPSASAADYDLQTVAENIVSTAKRLGFASVPLIIEVMEDYGEHCASWQRAQSAPPAPSTLIETHDKLFENVRITPQDIEFVRDLGAQAVRRPVSPPAFPEKCVNCGKPGPTRYGGTCSRQCEKDGPQPPPAPIPSCCPRCRASLAFSCKHCKLPFPPEQPPKEAPAKACPHCEGTGITERQEPSAYSEEVTITELPCKCKARPSSSASSFAERAQEVVEKYYGTDETGTLGGELYESERRKLIRDVTAFAQQVAAESEAKYAPLVETLEWITTHPAAGAEHPRRAADALVVLRSLRQQHDKKEVGRE